MSSSVPNETECSDLTETDYIFFILENWRYVSAINGGKNRPVIKKFLTEFSARTGDEMVSHLRSSQGTALRHQLMPENLFPGGNPDKFFIRTYKKRKELTYKLTGFKPTDVGSIIGQYISVSKHPNLN